MATRAKKAAAVRGSNMPTLFDMATIANIALTAFQDKSKADLMNGTATQRMACAVLATWLNWRNNGHPDKDVQTVPDLSIIVEKSEAGKNAMSTLKPLMSAALVGEALDYEGMSHDDKARAQSDRTNKLALLTRGMIPASILYRAGVTLDMFKRDIGCFAVKGTMLLEKGHAPLGALAAGNAIVLNNRTYSAENTLKDNAAVRVKASIDQLARAYRSQHDMTPKRDTNGSKKLSLKTIRPDQLSDGVELPTLIAALHKAFVTPKGVKNTQRLPNDLPAEAWQMLSDIAHENDSIQDSDVFRAAVKTGITPNAEVKTDTNKAA